MQKELVDNGNGKAIFEVNKVTVFSVSVTNAKPLNVSDNVSKEVEGGVIFEDIIISGKSLTILRLCIDNKYTKKALLSQIGVTNQTNNVRGIINPLLDLGLLAPVPEDMNRLRNVRFMATERGRAYLDYRKSLDVSEVRVDENKRNDELELFPGF